MKKSLFVSDLKNVGPNERIRTSFLVHSKEVHHKKSGSPYLCLTLVDRTGQLDARMWDNVPMAAAAFHEGDLVDVRGRMQVYNKRHQLIVHRLQALAEDQVFLGDFVPHTERDVEVMYGEVLAAIEGFSNPYLRRLMSAVFEDEEFSRLYRRAPAASSFHHARIGGLLEHVTSMLGVARGIAQHYTDLDSDLLLSGVLMHDVGKVFELTSDRTFEYTDVGRMVGHIAIGSAWLGQRCDEIDRFPVHLKTQLLHLVISHHGELEYGSPKVPLFPEAMALHLIDQLDAKLDMMRAAEAEIPEGAFWSPVIRGLERPVLNRRAYRSEDGPDRGADMHGKVEDRRPSEPEQAAPTGPPPLPRQPGQDDLTPFGRLFDSETGDA